VNDQIRAYFQTDFDAVTWLWRRARLQAFPEFEQRHSHTYEEDRAYFRANILPQNQIWVAELDGRLAGFMAQREDFIDQLYVDPDFQHRGIGTRFLALARRNSPSSLYLYTLEVNTNGRAFYAKNGFRAVKFSLSPPPENEPDIEYRWP
jgi:GNAT superfamily N-acetyltransferase